ncbi:MAG TPA: LysM peptidoglycan-binding domain-containing protein, partial [Pirellulales bacterium]|nr:LysM peptidoglycan-binding domain-containing protein [Pirellulales bacterium]
MSWLKPMMLMVVLGGILYGVYVVLNKGPAAEPPPGVAREWAKPPDIEIGVIDDGKTGSRTPAPGPAQPVSATPDNTATVYPWATPPTASNGNAASPDRSGMTVTPGVSASRSKPAGPIDPFGDSASSRTAPLASPSSNNSTTDPGRADANGPPATPVFSPSHDGSGSQGLQNDVAGKSATWPSGSSETFAAAMDATKALLAEGKLVEALRKLTKWHGNPQLTSEETAKLGELLSQLAGTVVYSRQHLLQPAYKVNSGDRLETIAAKYNVPRQLLAKINGIDDPNHINPGDELKVVRGPFTAQVDLDKRQLTLIVEDCYAGQFNIVAVGPMAGNVEGSFEVAEKLPNGPANGNSANGPIHHWLRLATS